MKSVTIVAGVAVALAAAVGIALYVANVEYWHPQAEAASTVRAEARQLLSSLNQDSSVHDADAQHAEAAAKRQLHNIFFEETRADGFTVAVWLTSEGHIPNAKQEAVLCIAYVSTRGGAVRMEDRACPPSAGSSLDKEYLTLDG